MSEVKREPMIYSDENGDELVMFDAQHTHADIVRWIVGKGIDDAKDFLDLLSKEVQQKQGLS